MNITKNNKIKIIAADDDPIAAMFWTKILPATAYQVTFVTNGKELLNSDWQNSDIIFTDVNMPEIDGVTAAAEISPLCSAPIIGVTANSSDDITKKCLAAGMKHILQKPLLPNSIAELITALIKNK